MVSNLGCVGLAVPDRARLRALVSLIMARVEPTPGPDGIVLYRWQDVSGARASLTARDGVALELLPSFAGRKSARLGTARPVAEDIYVAEIVDVNGDIVTEAHVEPEDRNAFAAMAEAGQPIGNVCLTAMGVGVAVHEDAEAFALAQESTSGPAETIADTSEPTKPLQMAAESFVSYSAFSAEAPDAYAMLNGTVLTVRVVTADVTQQRFVAAEVRCIGFDVTVCFPLPKGSKRPRPGNIIGGTVYLIASSAADSDFAHHTDRKPASQPIWRRLLGRSRTNTTGD